MYREIKGNRIHHTAVIGDNVKLGTGNKIMPYACIGAEAFIRGAENFKGQVVIGDNNIIGVHALITTGTEGITRIGSDCLIMNKSLIGHNAKVMDNCEIGVGSIICGYAEIMEGVKIKTGAIIRNRKKIGANAVVGMGSVVVSDVNSDDTVYGCPAKSQ